MIEAVSRMLSRQITVIVMEPRIGEPAIQKIGRTTDDMEEKREMTIIYRREHFNLSGGDRHRKEELGGRIFWMKKEGDHWKVDGWTSVPVEAKGAMMAARRKATGLTSTGGVKHHVQNVWQHVGGGDRQRRETDEKEWQKEDREDKAYVTTMMVMAFLMMGLTAIADMPIAVSATVVATGFVAKRNKAARMMMMMVLVAATMWLTVGSGGGDRNDGAIGGLVIPGMHPMETQGESGTQERPRIVHKMTFIGQVREKPIVVGFDDTFNELDVVRERIVDSSWKVLDHEGIGVHGVGDARFGKLLEMPMRYRYMSAETMMQVRIAADKHMPT